MNSIIYLEYLAWILVFKLNNKIFLKLSGKRSGKKEIKFNAAEGRNITVLNLENYFAYFKMISQNRLLTFLLHLRVEFLLHCGRLFDC